MSGNEIAQTIVGNDGDNFIDGRGGADALTGRLGNDNYVVDNSGDTIVELAGQGNDRVWTSASYALGTDVSIETFTTTLHTGTATIGLAGNGVAQTIVGNDGNNTIDGLGGNDTLTGRAGNDIFAFDSALGPSNVDTITDYSVANDTIRLENAILTALAAGPLPAGAFRNGAAAADGDDRIIYDSASGFLYYDADGLNGAAAKAFAKVTAGLALTEADFIVI